VKAIPHSYSANQRIVYWQSEHFNATKIDACEQFRHRKFQIIFARFAAIEAGVFQFSPSLDQHLNASHSRCGLRPSPVGDLRCDQALPHRPVDNGSPPSAPTRNHYWPPRFANGERRLGTPAPFQRLTILSLRPRKWKIRSIYWRTVSHKKDAKTFYRKAEKFLIKSSLNT
jgi:hypothetical protein